MSRAAPGNLAAEAGASASVAAAIPADDPDGVASNGTTPAHSLVVVAGTAQPVPTGLPAPAPPAAPATAAPAAGPAAAPIAPSTGAAFVHKRPPPTPAEPAAASSSSAAPNCREYSLERLCAEQASSKTARIVVSPAPWWSMKGPTRTLSQRSSRVSKLIRVSCRSFLHLLRVFLLLWLLAHPPFGLFRRWGEAKNPGPSSFDE